MHRKQQTEVPRSTPTLRPLPIAVSLLEPGLEEPTLLSSSSVPLPMSPSSTVTPRRTYRRRRTLVPCSAAAGRPGLDDVKSRNDEAYVLSCHRSYRPRTYVVSAMLVMEVVESPSTSRVESYDDAKGFSVQGVVGLSPDPKNSHRCETSRE